MTAMCLPPIRRCVVRARSVLITPGAARRVVVLLLLRLRLFLLFLVPRFSAVLDFGQEFADALDIFLTPAMDGSLAVLEGFRSRNFAAPQVVG